MSNQAQGKLTALKQLKAAYLQQMFPQDGESTPRLRFEGFSGDWEHCRLSDIGEILTGSTPPTSDVGNYSDSGMIWVTPTDITNHTISNSAKKLSLKGQEIARKVPSNSILVTCIASIGKNAMVLVPASFNQQINALVPNDNHHPYFLLTQSASWSAHMKNTAAAMTMQIVNKTEFSSIVAYIPCKEEQAAIGNFFRNLDNLIALHS